MSLMSRWIAHRLVGHAHGLEHPLVKGVLPGEQPVHVLEKQPRFGPLDDPVVVGRGQGHHLGDAQLGQHPRVGSLPLGRVVDGAHPDDHALPGHEPGYRLRGPMVPGLVRVAVAPLRSSAPILLVRTLRISSSGRSFSSQIIKSHATLDRLKYPNS